MKQNNVLGLEFVVVRDYSDRAPGLGTVTCAEFRDKEDALEYFRWQQRRWKDEAEKYGEPYFVWKLYKRTNYYTGTHPTGCEGELLEGISNAEK